MESKILIDINYSSREPQVVIHHKDSDDPRDKLISMFAGQAMPGVRDGYCRIERSFSQKDTDIIVIAPLDPIEAIKHIRGIVRLAMENQAINTDQVGDLIRNALKELTNEFFSDKAKT